MTKASIKEPYRSLDDSQIDNIVKVLQDFTYTETELTETILPNVVQWLYNNYVNKESTCLIISEIININSLQETIDNIYDGIIKLPARSKLNQYLTKEEYNLLEDRIEPRKNEKTITGTMNEDTNVKISFKAKKVYLQKEINSAEGKRTKETPIIEAVPQKVIVYDSPLIDQPRTFKIQWTSNVTDRDFVTSGENMGATIQEIDNYLINAGFSHNPRLLGGVVSCMINAMILNERAIIKKDIDNPGFYYDLVNDKIIPIDKKVTVPKRDELAKVARVLDKLHDFYKDNEDTLATVLKWGVMSSFSYAMKQLGKWMEWLYLKGSAGSGKTTLANLILYIYGVATPDNNIGGSSFDTVARVGAKLSYSCDAIVVNEPAAVFNRSSTKEMIKVCIESLTARRKFMNNNYAGIPAFAPVLFTANQYLPEDDALLRRMYVLSFSYSQRKTDAEKKAFEDTFHISTPKLSILKDLNFLGQFAASYIVSNPSLLLDDWKVTADKIITALYEEMGTEVPEWLMSWAESENLEDFDNNQREDIRNFFVNEFNQARKKISIQYNQYDENTLDVDTASTSEDFKEINWNIVNNRMLAWAIPFTSRNHTKYVCLTQSLRKSLSERLDFCDDLKSIGELLGWKYKNTRFGNKQMKTIKINFNEFMDFLYPNVEFEED